MSAAHPQASTTSARTLPHRTKIDLPEDTRQRLVTLLNQRLAESIALTQQAKQAHWNVRGPHFIALHQLFDQIYESTSDHVDLLAERIGQLGGAAEGTVVVAAQRAHQQGLPDYPLNISDGNAHLDALSTSLAAFGKIVRQAIDQATELRDAGTADLFTEISRSLDKSLWFVEAHLQGHR